jgi:hypothetical protein
MRPQDMSDVVANEDCGTRSEPLIRFIGEHLDGDFTSDAVWAANAADRDAHESAFSEVEEVDTDATPVVQSRCDSPQSRRGASRSTNDASHVIRVHLDIECATATIRTHFHRDIVRMIDDSLHQMGQRLIEH